VIVGWSIVLRVLVASASFAGCALLAGIDDGNGRPIASVEGGASGAGADAVASPVEGGAATDAPPGSCTAGNAADSDSLIHATKVQPQAPVVIDGADGEWACVDTLAFTAGQRVVGLGPGRGVANIAMQWDEQHLYLVARVTTGSGGGTAPAATNYKNDSFDFFVAGPNPALAYTSNDHHYVVDYLDQVTDYEISTRPAALGITAKAGTVRDDNTTLTFVVEERIDASNIGRAALAKGDKVRVNFQVNDQPDVGNNYRLWFRDTVRCVATATCPPGEPYCDPRCTGEVELR
jgi:hypothetical protein